LGADGELQEVAGCGKQNEKLGEILDRAGKNIMLEWQQCYGSVREQNDVNRQQAYLSNSCVLHGQPLILGTNSQWYITQGTLHNTGYANKEMFSELSTEPTAV
jgi:hypothetical protein